MLNYMIPAHEKLYVIQYMEKTISKTFVCDRGIQIIVRPYFTYL